MSAEDERLERVKADAGIMLEALPEDYDPRRVAEAAAAVLGATIGVMIAEDMFAAGMTGAGFDAYMQMVEAFAFAGVCAHDRTGAGH